MDYILKLSWKLYFSQWTTAWRSLHWDRYDPAHMDPQRSLSLARLLSILFHLLFAFFLFGPQLSRTHFFQRALVALVSIEDGTAHPWVAPCRHHLSITLKDLYHRAQWDARLQQSGQSTSILLLLFLWCIAQNSSQIKWSFTDIPQKSQAFQGT